MTKILRIEASLLFLASLYLFNLMGISWGFIALFFFLPDLSLVGYFMGPKKGAYFYNVAHSKIGPVVLAASGALLNNTYVLHLACVWWSHVNFDRMLGYGLKTTEGFNFTHFGPILRNQK